MDLSQSDMREMLKKMGDQRKAYAVQEKAEKIRNYRELNQVCKKGGILFTGSSLMEQFPIVELAVSDGRQELIYNRGVGGYTTDEFLEEMDVVLFDLEPSKIFINIGTNDMMQREDGEDWETHLLSNYERILDEIQRRLPQSQVYMMAYYPVNAGLPKEGIQAMFMAHMFQTRTNENIDRINDRLCQMAKTHGIHYIDVNEGLRDETGNLRADLTKEGIHMYASAYRIVYDNLKSYL